MNWLKQKLIDLYVSYSMWRNKKALYKEIDEVDFKHSAHEIKEEQTAKLYTEGLAEMKRKIRGLDSSKILSTLGDNRLDLIDLARNETDEQKELKKIKKSIYTYEGKDVGKYYTQEAMIDQRINEYRKLHKHIEQRNLLKQIRKFKQEGNTQEAEQLEQKWRDKYERS